MNKVPIFSYFLCKIAIFFLFSGIANSCFPIFWPFLLLDALSVSFTLVVTVSWELLAMWMEALIACNYSNNRLKIVMLEVFTVYLLIVVPMGMNVSHASTMISMKNIAPTDTGMVKALELCCKIVPHFSNQPSQNNGFVTCLRNIYTQEVAPHFPTIPSSTNIPCI